MADRASADRVAADMNPPNFRAAIKLIRTAIVAKKTRISSINGEISDQWGKVEGYKVNKKAGRVFLMLDSFEHDERTDFIRSLNGLIDASDWNKDGTDLVDKAQGNVVPLHVNGANRGGEQQDDEHGDDDDTGDGEAEMQEVERVLDEPAAGSRRSRKAKAEPAPKGENDVARAADARRAEMREKLNPTPKPYEGDDTDLAES